jgi:dTMP kinase
MTAGDRGPGPAATGRAGLLITFEGPEGSGKTTLVEALAARLGEAGRACVVLREPGGTPLGERIRQILLDPAASAMCAETELLLMVASRAQLVREAIRPALAAGKIVLCDRFADASVAYQGYGRGLGEEIVKRFNDFALDGLAPDLTFLCMLPPADGLRRLAARRTDRLDRESAAFHERVHAAYEAMAGGDDPRFCVLDASQPPAGVLAQALARLKRMEQGLLDLR